MSALSLSVIVVSRHRPAALSRCLKGLRQQIGTELEIVVVADPAAAARVSSEDLKIRVYDEPNISAARNLGLAEAAGNVVAFIDDDAVPEPTWAARMLAAFADKDTVAATGFVRGRNGISYQWRGMAVDREGQDHPLAVPESGVHYPDPGAGCAVKTQGTNCAFRASALRQIGGFDPAYRFFLDETDVNLRLIGLGRTAVVPLAQVHHGYMASDRRRADRVPLSLFEIAASTAVFLRRHAPQSLATGRERLWREQGARVEAHRRARRIGQEDARALMDSLEAGWSEGLERPMGTLAPLPERDAQWRPARVLSNGQGVVLTGWSWNRKRLEAMARDCVAEGMIVSVLCLSPGVRRHWLSFHEDGFWIQTGGVWGRAERSIPVPFFRVVVGKFGLLARQKDILPEFGRFRPVDGVRVV